MEDEIYVQCVFLNENEVFTTMCAKVHSMLNVLLFLYTPTVFVSPQVLRNRKRRVENTPEAQV